MIKQGSDASGHPPQMDTGAESAAPGKTHAGRRGKKSTQDTSNVFEEIESAMGGIDSVLSWLHWERRTDGTVSPIDRLTDEQRAAFAEALARFDKAQRRR